MTWTKAKRATAFQVATCNDPDCKAVHVLLFDESDSEFAEFGVTPENLTSFVNDLFDAHGVALAKKSQTRQ